MRISLTTVAGLLVSACFVSAQTPVHPGQLAPPPSQFPLIQISTVKQPADKHDRFMNRLWIASMSAMVASSSMDAATSWGKVEGNGLLASSNGTFGARGVSIKAGMAAAVILPQVLLRNHKSLRTKFIFGNFLEAGIFTGVSIYNLHVTAPAN